MKKKIIITSIMIVCGVIYSVLSFVLPKEITPEIALANWYVLGGLILCCLINFLLMDNKDRVCIASLIHSTLTIISGIIEICLNLQIKYTLVIELALIFIYLVFIFTFVGTGHVEKKERIDEE